MGILEKEDEKKNVLMILHNTRKALKTKDTLLLREMSNRTIHCASIHKDPTSVVIAVTVYALSKIIARRDYAEHKDWPSFFSRISKDVNKAIEHLEENKIKEFHEDMKNIRQAVSELSGRLKYYIKDVFRIAQINKASRLYEHGISRSETSSLLDITQWELAEYIGKTGIPDVTLSLTMPIKERIKFTSKLFE
ncbi:MAG: hypothetical protein IB618_02360 [Candidatus Pacearchaeota archaeon]|nr:MAG: hypothetical protein IB618_02360 [Candidatus Pacearchaeota archaeon]